MIGSTINDSTLWSFSTNPTSTGSTHYKINSFRSLNVSSIDSPKQDSNLSASSTSTDLTWTFLTSSYSPFSSKYTSLEHLNFSRSQITWKFFVTEKSLTVLFLSAWVFRSLSEPLSDELEFFFDFVFWV